MTSAQAHVHVAPLPLTPTSHCTAACHREASLAYTFVMNTGLFNQPLLLQLTHCTVQFLNYCVAAGPNLLLLAFSQSEHWQLWAEALGAQVCACGHVSGPLFLKGTTVAGSLTWAFAEGQVRILRVWPG